MELLEITGVLLKGVISNLFTEFRINSAEITKYIIKRVLGLYSQEFE